MKLHTMKFFLLAFSLSFVISAPVSVGAEPGYDPKALEALIEEGNSKLLAGKTKAACRSFEKAVKLSAGQSYNAQLGWATALLKAKEPEAALAPAAAAERLSTNDKMRSTAAFLSGLAQYQNQPNDPVALAKAATSLEKAIELAPERTAQARVTLGYVYRALGQFDPAITHLRNAIPFLATESPMRREARILLCTIRYEKRELPIDLSHMRTDNPPKEDDATKAPVKVFAPDPVYDEESRLARIQGQYVAQSIIDKDGCVTGLLTLESPNEALGRSARAAIQRWVFEPATLEGSPVDVYFNLTVNFRLKPGVP